ncbi:hypothetical protein OIO90_001863 [Microbotryomycetes sp. JL221]|nr:hypothetical protein OIO90_001863 [Microbotryomycetes sp. JL221]
MGNKLRMKDTTDQVNKAIKRAHKQSRKRQRQTQQRQESLTPPRHQPVDWGFDESTVPPHQAYKASSFQERLYQAQLQDDQTLNLHEQWSSTSFSYPTAAAQAMGHESSTPLTSTDVMDEEEYAEYIRAGMWRIKHKDEIERLHHLEQQRKHLEQEQQRQRTERQTIERQRQQRLKVEQSNREQEHRTRFEHSWTKLMTNKNHDVRFTDVAWPMYPPVPLPPLSWPSLTEVTLSNVEHFLLGHVVHDDVDVLNEKKRQIVRQHMLMFHPDRFNRIVERVQDSQVQDRVSQLGLRVSQVLNDLNKSLR